MYPLAKSGQQPDLRCVDRGIRTWIRPNADIEPDDRADHSKLLDADAPQHAPLDPTDLGGRQKTAPSDLIERLPHSPPRRADVHTGANAIRGSNTAGAVDRALARWHRRSVATPACLPLIGGSSRDALKPFAGSVSR